MAGVADNKVRLVRKLIATYIYMNMLLAEGDTKFTIGYTFKGQVNHREHVQNNKPNQKVRRPPLS